MNKSFSLSLKRFADLSKTQMTAAHRRSVELLGEEMSTTKPQGGLVPFLSGDLYRSLLASTSAMPKTAEAPFSGSNVGVVAATLELNQPVWLGYQAIYARRQNYGYVGADSLGRVYNQHGSYFVEGAIANWQKIVAQAVAELQNPTGGKE